MAAVLISSSGRPAAINGLSASQLKRIWPLFTATLLLLTVGLRWLVSMHPFPGDLWAARLGASSKPWVVFAITRAYQQIGRPLVAVAEVLLMLAWLWHSSDRRTAQGLLIVLIASVTCGLVKIVCGPTPLWLELHHVGTNFPSGVVTFTTATGGYLAVVARRQGRKLAPALLIAIVAGAGPARILGGQHVLSDVLGGYMVGLAWLIPACVYMWRSDQSAAAESALNDPGWKITSVETPAWESVSVASRPAARRAGA